MRIKIAVTCVLVLLTLAGVYSFFYQFQTIANRVQAQHGFDSNKANAIKHAYAASQMYRVSRAVGFSEGVSKNIVYFLGDMSERAELLMRGENKDSTLEIIRDLHNNYVGVCAADVFDMNVGTSLLDSIVDLANRNVLYNSVNMVSLAEVDRERFYKSSSLTEAKQWLKTIPEFIHCDEV
jgi:hypothetical protein